jgi:YbbR domain-containing protein
MGWISNNAGLKVVSLVLATFTWFFIQRITSDSRTINNVPLEVKAKSGLTVLQTSDSTVNVTVRGTPEDVRQVSQQDLSAVVDLTGDEMVERDLSVQPQFGGELPPNLSVERVVTQPESVKVKGPKTLLSGMANIATLPIDVTGRRTSFRERVELTPLAFPEGLAQRRWVEVDVRIGTGHSVDTGTGRGIEQRP